MLLLLEVLFFSVACLAWTSLKGPAMLTGQLSLLCMGTGVRNTSRELHPQLLEAHQTFSHLQISSADNHCTTQLRLQAATGKDTPGQLCRM